ncbi:Tumor susceptibility gene 101 protein [Galdieria sulphuraria]|nr:Tumor susceptibility gene 101 protein [Galdieria sulphuraria]
MDNLGFFQGLAQNGYDNFAIQRLQAELTEIKQKGKKLGFTIGFHPIFKHKMCCLEGVVIIVYKERPYNIPVSIWIPAGYPRYPPQVHVVPTSSMILKQGHKYMDPQGVVHHEVLNRWNPQMYGLSTIIQVLEVIFSQEPPVFAKRAEQMPKVSPINQSVSHIKSDVGDDNEQNFQVAASRSQKKSSLKSMVRSKYAGPVASNIPAQLAAPNLHASYQHYPTSPWNTNSMTLTPEELKRRELVEKASERIRVFLATYVQQSRTEIAHLLEQRNQCLAASESIDAEMTSATQEQEETEMEYEQVQTVYDDLSQWLEKEKPRLTEMNLDSFVIFPTKILNKIEKMRAMNAAYQDALCLLDEALQEEVISLEQFLKEVRKISKEQYQLRSVLKELTSNTK